MARDVSRRWQQSIGKVNRWITEVSWSNDGFRYVGDTIRYRTDYPTGMLTGTVTCDANDAVRWKTELSVQAPFGRKGINPFRTQVRIKHGIAWSTNTGDEELLGMGWYKVMNCNRSRQEPGRVNLTGESFERVLLNARFRRAKRWPSNYADARLEQMITQIIPSASIVWSPKVASRRLLPRTMIERDRWEAIDGGQQAGSIAKALGARIYTDGAGVWRVMPTPSLQDKIAWTADEGPGGVLINSTDEYTNEYVYNAVVVTGENTDEDVPTVGPIAVIDDDPYSFTYYRLPVDEGGFGPKPKFYTSQLITSNAQAITAGRGLLAPSLGLRQQITFDSLHDPSKEVGDVGLVADPDGIKERVILDSITYDLLGAPLSCQTRTTQTRLAGDQELSPGDEGDVEGEMAA